MTTSKYMVIVVNEEIKLLVLKRLDNGHLTEVWYHDGQCKYKIGDLV